MPLRHPNRNTSKGEDQYKAKENKPESDKTINETFTEERTTAVPEELPGTLTKELFSDLATHAAPLCISLYLETHKAGVEINERYDVIAFKNSLQDIAKRLQAQGVEQTLVERLLEPGYELLRDDTFWVSLSPGLAVFIADGYFKYIKMPFAATRDIMINSSFFVSPLVPLMTTSEYFYLLVISKKKAKLFRADASGMSHVPVEDLPESLEDVKRLSEKDASTWRTGARGGTGGANFHGAGGGNPDDKTNIAVYFEAVDDILFKEVFNKENAPLVLAGVEYLIPIYRSVCDYHNVWPESLTGSHEYTETNLLFAQARELMEPYFRQRISRALENFGNQSATALTSSIAADVIPAAHYGRVSHLFVQKGEHIWGRFDESTSELSFHATQQEGSEDLLDHTVIKAILTGAEVFLLEKEQMPADSQLAAIFRY